MDLLEFLKRNNESARKIFGKAEIKIIEKQILGLTLKQSERNRLSRDVRKKLEFIKEIGKYSDEFELKHGDKIKKVIEETKEDILNSKYSLRIKKIVLFGSSVEMNRHLGSDIDIAVEFDKIDSREATEFRTKFGRGDMSDIQVYNVLPEKIKKEINNNGKVIYERKNK